MPVVVPDPDDELIEWLDAALAASEPGSERRRILLEALARLREKYERLFAEQSAKKGSAN